MFFDEDDDRIRLRFMNGRLKRFAILRCAKIKNLGNMGAIRHPPPASRLAPL